MYVCIPDTLAFQRMFEVSGAGPVENRVNPESPINCGHSYWSSVELAGDKFAMGCVINKVEFKCRLNTEAKRDEPRRNAKITIAFNVCVNPLPPE